MGLDDKLLVPEMWIQNFEFHFFPGTDDWEYEWIDEGSTDAHPISNGDGGAQSPGDDVIRKKSVSFAAQQELRTSMSLDSLSSLTNSSTAVSASAPINSNSSFYVSVAFVDCSW